MKNYLSELLKKRGIKDASELSKDEQADFERWKKILAKDEVDIKDVLGFCKNQIIVIEKKFGDIENTPQKAEKLTMNHSIYKTLINLIEQPKEQREALIKYLTSLIE